VIFDVVGRALHGRVEHLLLPGVERGGLGKAPP
jgi:hypothetical protein